MKTGGGRGRGTLTDERPPIVGMIQRNGEVIIRLLHIEQQATIKNFTIDTIEPDTMIFTEEYDIYIQLSEWGYQHISVNHGACEYLRDEKLDLSSLRIHETSSLKTY